jgi:AraC-like DNA-binding protein
MSADVLRRLEEETRAPRAEPSEELPRAAAHVPFVVESLSPAEQRASFRVGDSWHRASTLSLPSGARLSVAACQFEPSFSFFVDQPPSELELVVSKGAVMQSRTEDGDDLPRGGHSLQLGRSKRPLKLHVSPTDDAPMECVSVSLSVRRLRELLGVTELPQAFRRVLDSKDPYPLITRALTPALYRLLDEISNADVRGPSRLLWHDAKSLELIALMTDELIESAREEQPLLSAQDIDRLERARARLVANLETPPTLAELARTAGVNESKLKIGFRALFGTSVFAYLRRVRMEEAQRLLRERRLNVTEVAQLVGYANPSKFAAAFRRQFGTSPSTL